VVVAGNGVLESINLLNSVPLIVFDNRASVLNNRASVPDTLYSATMFQLVPLKAAESDLRHA
jgi:hypothetical protein